MTAFWMTWKPEGWPIEELRRLIATFQREGTVVEPWRVFAHRRVAIGDAAFLFKQGVGPRGIFGVGTIVGNPEPVPERSRDPARPQHYVPVRISKLVDPTQEMLLPLSELADVVPQWFVDIPASGYALPDAAGRAIASRLGVEVAEEQARNPPWNRDELILALDAYVHWNGQPPAKTSEDIAELSSLLNDLRHVLGTRGEATLRNPNGVYMKLMNFRRFDPTYTDAGKSGLSRGNRLEGEVWDEFHGDPPRLKRVADTIKAGLAEALSAGQVSPSPPSDGLADSAEAVEGAIITVMHQQRERSRALVEKRKAAAMTAAGRLLCEACGFDFVACYGERGAGFIECHHTRAVETLGDGTPTKLQDLALLCSNCHRMVHARRPWLTIPQLRAILDPT